MAGPIPFTPIINGVDVTINRLSVSGAAGEETWGYNASINTDKYTISGNTVVWNDGTILQYNGVDVLPTANIVDGGSYTTRAASSKLSVDLTTLSGWANLSSGNHTIKIKAKGTGYKDSELSVGVTVSKAAVNPNVVSTTGLQSNQTLVANTNAALLDNSPTAVKNFYNNYKSKSLTELLQGIDIFPSEERTIDGVVVKFGEYDKLSEDCSIFVIKEGNNYYFETTGQLSETIVSSPQLTGQTYEPAKIIFGLVSASTGKFYTLPCKNITGEQGTLESLSDLGVAFIAFRTKVTLEEGTYKFIDNPTLLPYPQPFADSVVLNFTSNGVAYELLKYVGSSISYWTDKNDIDTLTVVYNGSNWTNDNYKTIILATSQTVSAEFYNWAITQGNLVKQTGYNLTINYSTVPMSTAAAYIKINSDTVSSTNYDYVVQPGTSSTNPTLKNSAGTTLTVPYVVPNVEKVAFMGGLAIGVNGRTNNTSPYTLTADTTISPGVYGPTADTPIDEPTI